MELQRPRNSNKSNVEIEEKPIVIKKNTRFIPEAELNEVKQGTVTYESELLKYAFFPPIFRFFEFNCQKSPRNREFTIISSQNTCS